MVVTVVAMGMVQMTVDDVVDMVAVPDRFVTAVRAVNVTGVMAGTTVLRRALVRVRFGHLQYVPIAVILVRVMQLAVVEIVDVSIVHDGGVAAAGAMDVRMIGNGFAV
jgi:hypothetical protein